jgi:hypothetical protein
MPHMLGDESPFAWPTLAAVGVAGADAVGRGATGDAAVTAGAEDTTGAGDTAGAVDALPALAAGVDACVSVGAGDANQLPIFS